MFDVRQGEGRGGLVGFTLLLLLIIGAHTTMETVRDALLLTGPGSRALGFVYMAIAVGTLPGAAIAARVGERFGQRRALGVTLAVAVAGPVLLFFLPASRATALATYVTSGVLGSIVVPQFWMLVGTVLTVAQSRRLFGFISAGGTVGGVLGPALASAALVFVPVRALLLVSSLLFAGAAAALHLIRVAERCPEPAQRRRIPLTTSLRALKEQPFLLRVALVVFLSTATFFAVDYLFKSTLARALPGPRIAPFVAHYYLVLNGVSLLMQLLLTSTVIRGLGMIPALVLTPLMLVAGAALAGGGVLPGALLVKSIDGTLRYSIHRVTGELLYLPVPAPARQHIKPFIDGALARSAQMMTGAGLLALGGTSLLGPRPLTWIVAGLSAAWLATAITMRRPYLNLLRSAITSGSLDASDSPEPIDLETAQLLVQRLASEDPFEVGGAMTALSRRDRAGFVPALVLLQKDEGVLVQALELFGGSTRSDWFAQARRLLGDPREVVRVAAARALSRHEQLDAACLAHDVGWLARGYAAVRMALRDASTEVVGHAAVASLLGSSGEAGDTARLGLLEAICDAPPTARLSPLLRLLAREPQGTREKTELLARAAARQQDPSLVPPLVLLLARREGREEVRRALVALGQPALEEVWRTLRDGAHARRLRLQMPKTLARFANRQAAQLLLDEIELEEDGLIRYKAIRALRLLATALRIPVDRQRTERYCAANLETHFRYLSLRRVWEVAGGPAGTTEALLRALLSEKAAHALERAFHLLQIAHPRQGVHHAYVACRSEDAFARANGAELIDTLLRRRDQRRLRGLFRLATDELLLEDRVERSRSLVALPRTRDEGVAALLGERDAMLVALGQRLRGALASRPPAAVS